LLATPVTHLHRAQPDRWSRYSSTMRSPALPAPCTLALQRCRCGRTYLLLSRRAPARRSSRYRSTAASAEVGKAVVGVQNTRLTMDADVTFEGRHHVRRCRQTRTLTGRCALRARCAASRSRPARSASAACSPTAWRRGWAARAQHRSPASTLEATAWRRGCTPARRPVRTDHASVLISTSWLCRSRRWRTRARRSRARTWWSSACRRCSC